MMIPNPSSTPSLYSNRKRFQMFSKVIPLLLVMVAIGIGIWQLPLIREFLGRAAGENANIFIDTQGVLGPMPRPWRNLAQGGEGFDWRLQPLVSSVKVLHPRYIRLDHIYDFYDIVKGTPGNITFDFSKFDKVIDDILATGAKPYISLSYMPPAISAGDIVAKPQRWEDWSLVVQKTIEHVSGDRRISDVYYEVWNEPDLFGGWKTYGDKNYITLYNYAAQGAARARGVNSFKFGGPAITALYKNWFDTMANNAVKNNVRMDFFSWHRYSTNLDQFRDDMFNARTWLSAYPQLEPTLELNITEWGHDSNNNAGYDSTYAAAHTVAGSIQMMNVVDKAFVFEIQDGADPKGQTYWGRWGMFTAPNAGAKPKPRYNALRMLDRIADQRLSLKGQGSWTKAVSAKADDGRIQVVLANYDARGSHTELVPITFQNIAPGQYMVTRQYLNGQRQVEQVATSEAALKVNVPMSVNAVGFVELIPQTVQAVAAPATESVVLPTQ